ncbi:Sulfotransferase family protein [Stieleria neptunia]|uniref:Sulfotransferase family protein n=1 Tax=Stieleria neptunia TaxID=2527979 RepID=A0A518HR27_9BACT|nr:Sulfotransferase family protein [Stieleria neptunia]
MISHKYQCIFIHIPRVAGTSIEKWLCGSDWWEIDPATKHLLASQARQLYSDFWESYFKFTFVRNPWDRMVSALKFPDYFGVRYDRGRIPPFGRSLDFGGYKTRFGPDPVVEFDHRFYERSSIVSPRHAAKQVYGNIIDEPIDFIGRFETLVKDCSQLRDILGVDEIMTIHSEKSTRKARYRHYYNTSTAQEVADMYANDNERFGFAF